MSTQTLRGSFEELAARIGGWPEIPKDAYTDPREELIYRYSVGTGKFVAQDGKNYIEITTKLYKLNGDLDGHYEGVDEPVVDLRELLKRPSPPRPPFDEPSGPVDHVPVLSYSKGIWTFADGSSIYAIGPANLHTVQYVDGAHNLWVTANQLIVGGSGRYHGCQGTKIVAGSSWVPKGVPLDATNPFSVKTIEGFRVIRKEHIGTMPSA